MTTLTRLGLLALALSSLTLVGCGGSAWQVRRGTWSGELALHGSVIDAHYRAEDIAMEHCGGRARFVYGAEAERIAVADDSAVPARGVEVDHGGERVRYVCVERAPLAFRDAPAGDAERDGSSPALADASAPNTL
jgi:hypothetical protein